MNCPKHVEFYPKNKFEKLVNLVGFIIRIYHDARSPESQKWTTINIVGGDQDGIQTAGHNLCLVSRKCSCQAFLKKGSFYKNVLKYTDNNRVIECTRVMCVK